MSLSYSIEVAQLTKKFDSFTAVDNISFKVKSGEIFGFVGPNGAGKTTTVNILCTLVEQSSGQVTINGYDTRQNPQEVRKSIGVLFQDQTLDSYLTAYENLKFHAVAFRVPKKEQEQRIDKMLNLVGLSSWKNKGVKIFSGGMKRRLEIARALLHRPKVLFLDEPTLGLDPQTRNKVWQYLLALKETENTTIFLTTHYMDEAEHCNRFAVINKGEIIALDSPAELKKSLNKSSLNEVFLHLVGQEIPKEIAKESEKIKEVAQRKERP